MKREVGAPQAAGFTIIEVMLFLAISGAMVVALLVTVGSTISRQRFSDSIVSTQAFLQSQENETLNVINDRSAASCSGGIGSTMIGIGSDARGASNCVILGRALDFTMGSSQVTMYTVVGYEPALVSAATPTALIAQYAPVIDTSSSQKYDVAWGEKVTGIHPAGVKRVLLLRSPDSGLVLTFAGLNTADAVANGVRGVNICFDTKDVAGTKALVALSTVSGAEGISTQFEIPTSQQAVLCS